MMKTKLEIIDETVAYYSEDPVNRRAASLSNDCKYFTLDGKMCAVGRCAKDPKYLEFTYSGISPNGISDFEHKLKVAYRGHEIIFWKKLQALHDRRSHWNETGLTEEGLAYVEEIKQEYSEN